MAMPDIEMSKRKACENACELLARRYANARVVGMGTGSTVKIFIDICTWFLKDKVVVASSPDTALYLVNHGLNTVDPISIDRIDIYIDSADEVNSNLDMVKGRGGAFLREKTLAYMSGTRIYIIDHTKYTGVDYLYLKPIPIEIVPVTLNHVLKSIKNLDLFEPVLRVSSGKDGPVLSDNGNYIVDLKPLKPLKDPENIHKTLKLIHGVVETGIFPSKQLVDIVIVGYPDKIITFNRDLQV
ncbi:MAG: ribose 5-phosphate isomerase A [Desulfurococcaceae archaeon]